MCQNGWYGYGECTAVGAWAEIRQNCAAVGIQQGGMESPLGAEYTEEDTGFSGRD